MIYIIAFMLILLASYWLLLSPYSQIFGKYPYRVKTKQKIVALTFDDGPNEPYTTEIFNYLNSKNIKATFFMVGKCVQKYPEVANKIDKTGHTIGVHSMSHEFSKYFTQPSFSKELLDTRNTIAKTIGKTPSLVRFPWLMRHPLMLRSAHNIGLQPISGVFCSSLEVFQVKGQTIAKHALAKVKPGSIIIFHDGFDSKGGDRTQTVSAVKIVVEELIIQGYKFKTVNELLNIKPYK